MSAKWNESPVLSAQQIEHIWQRLAMTYGHDWLARWRGFDLDDVKAEWRSQLGSLADWQIAHALDNLPERAPSLPKFRAIALEAHMPVERQLAYEQQEPELPPPTHAQQARIAAHMARIWAAFGDERRADEARARCAEQVELARDSGEETPSAGALAEQVEAEVAAVRAERVSKEQAQYPERRADGKPWQFDLAALLRRQGTEAEQRRDWARVIAAKVERGEQVSSFVRRKAQQALAGFEREEWLETGRAQQRAKPAPVPATMPEVRNDPWAEGAWL